MYVMEGKLLTVEEVADKLQVSRDVVWRLIRQKKLVAYRISGSLRIRPDDLQKYLDSQRTDQTE
jgi:excisionase family DNA binding protein